MTDDIIGLFSPSSRQQGLPEKWLRLAKEHFQRLDSGKAKFEILRLLQFAKVYRHLLDHDEIHTLIYFQNPSGDNHRDILTALACLVDGTFESMPGILDDHIPTVWNNPALCFSKDEDEIKSCLKERADKKLVLITAYATFKAGANLQYPVPSNLHDVYFGEHWDDETIEKDWDAVYLQTPTCYPLHPADENGDLEHYIYNLMLFTMMCYDRGYFSSNQVAYYMRRALAKERYLGLTNDENLLADKVAWMQSFIEQAVGRICRTRNKPAVTHILFDDDLAPFIRGFEISKSVTPEFEALVDFAREMNQSGSEERTPEQLDTLRKADCSQRLVKRMLSIALSFNGNRLDRDFEDFESDPRFKEKVWKAQKEMSSFKRLILQYPTIESIADLPEDLRRPEIVNLYGKWPVNDDGGYEYRDKEASGLSKSVKSRVFNPANTFVDVFMKNDIIRSHFVKNGLATPFEPKGMIIHPQILAEYYKGEIGEEAFKALAVHYCDCPENVLRHLTHEDYELADFCISGSDGRHLLAFSVKNYNPEINHLDSPNDIPSHRKIASQRERLGCPVITVNILRQKKSSADGINEITGLLNADGSIVHENIEILKLQIHNALKKLRQ